MKFDELSTEVNSFLKRLAAFIRLGRPLFLVGGFVLHGLGAAMALYRGASLNGAAFLWGQVAITSIQWMTHYANDYFDLAADRSNQTPTNWSGGSRVLVENQLPPQTAFRTARILSYIAILAALIVGLLIVPAPLTLPLFALALFLAWYYSAPPLHLHSRGLGELSGAVLISGLTPLVGFYLQARHLEGLPFLAIFPLCCFQFAMLLAIEFPDAAGDNVSGKRTLVIRLGAKRAAWLYCTVLALAYLSLPLLMLAGLPPPVALGVALLSPLAFLQIVRAGRGDYTNPARQNSFAFSSVALLIATAFIEFITFLLLYLAT